MNCPDHNLSEWLDGPDPWSFDETQPAQLEPEFFPLTRADDSGSDADWEAL
jgi:hypothetical protein